MEDTDKGSQIKKFNMRTCNAREARTWPAPHMLSAHSGEKDHNKKIRYYGIMAV